MLKRLRSRLEQIEQKKFKQFEDFEPLIKKIYKDYAPLFPKYKVIKNGSSFVYHFSIPGVPVISLEKPHGSRDCIPPKFAKFAIQGISDILDYVEANVPDKPDTESEEQEYELRSAKQKEPRLLPAPKISDGDC